MKLVILGANGACGQQLVSQALERGHQVTAVVRSTSWQAPSGAVVKRGALSDAKFLTDAMAGADALACALGLRMSGIAPWARAEDPDFLSRAAAAAVAAMKAAGVKRAIAISAGGVGDSEAQVPAAFRFFIKASALRHVYPELAKMEALLLDSGLDVCLCRPTGLTDGPKTGAVKIVTAFSGRAAISRADLAAWMLDQLALPAFTSRTPMITVTGAP